MVTGNLPLISLLDSTTLRTAKIGIGLALLQRARVLLSAVRFRLGRHKKRPLTFNRRWLFLRALMQVLTQIEICYEQDTPLPCRLHRRLINGRPLYFVWLSPGRVNAKAAPFLA